MERCREDPVRDRPLQNYEAWGGGGGGLFDIDAADLGPAGAAVEGSFELIENSSRSFGQGFDATVVEIANPAAEAEAYGFLLDKVTEADPLDTATDEVSAAGGHRPSPWGLP